MNDLRLQIISFDTSLIRLVKYLVITKGKSILKTIALILKKLF